MTGIGADRRVIPLAPILDVPGPLGCVALPGFCAFTLADQTGKFARKGKISCWQAWNQCDSDVLSAFAFLGTSSDVTPDIENAMKHSSAKCTTLVPQ